MDDLVQALQQDLPQGDPADRLVALDRVGHGVCAIDPADVEQLL
jgi:hypothetical protein